MVSGRTRTIPRLVSIVLGGWLCSGFSLARGSDGPPRSELILEPSSTKLVGPLSSARLLATERGSEGAIRDLTRVVNWGSLDPTVVSVAPDGRLLPVGEGVATIVALDGNRGASATVEVVGLEAPKPVSFRGTVIPALSQAGCNMGACHGTPTGKGGFRLSLRGYLPDQDFEVLSRDAAGRRINVLQPDSSLILRKPLGLVAHEGGIRFAYGSSAYTTLKTWIAEGARDDPDAPAAVSLEILPGDRMLDGEADNQQIVALATYADGTSRDVTDLCYYDSSSPEIATVDPSGFVQFATPGEVAVIAHYLDLVANVRLTHLVPVPSFEPAPVPAGNIVDSAVFAKLNAMRIAPSETCTDDEFVRRAYLDAIGVLPSPEERERFLADPRPDRRAVLVDELLERPEFDDFWTLKFADILRANSRLIQSKGANVFHRWIRQSLATRKPLDQFVRELLTAEGSTFRNPAANYYRISREPEASVETTAQLFLGVRIQCAKCHNHPFERWTQDDYYGFAAFFARVRQKPGNVLDEEVIFASNRGEVRQPRTGTVMAPKALGGPTFEDDKTSEARRERLAEWLTAPENPFFAKSLVNRVWYHLMGRGIVEPVDDFRDSNPPSNDELLDGLASDFISGGYDLRHLVRTILTSQTYALSARPNDLNGDDDRYFSRAYTKLLPAEVLLDAISTLTGASTTFAGLPEGVRATQIPDGKVDDPFLKTFGRPARELACECERETDSNLGQALQLIGGATVNDKLRSDEGRLASLAAGDEGPEAIVRELYLVALSREPDPGELAAASEHIAGADDRRQAVEDLGWVLINTKEFLFRH